MTKEEIANKIKDLGKWFHYMELDGVPTKDKNEIYVEGLKNPERMYCSMMDALNFTGKDCLDIGCNAGFFSFKLAQRGNRVLGVDIRQSGAKTIEQANFAESILQTGAKFQEGNFMELPDKQYDVVLFLGVLYHLYDYAAGMDKVASLVKAGGTLIFETAYKGETEFHPQGVPHDKTTFFYPSEGWIIDALTKRGFTIVKKMDWHRYMIEAKKE